MIQKKAMGLVFIIIISLTVLLFVIIFFISILSDFTGFLEDKSDLDLVKNLDNKMSLWRTKSSFSKTTYSLNFGKDYFGICLFDNSVKFNPYLVRGNLTLKYINTTINYEPNTILNAKYKTMKNDNENSGGMLIFKREKQGSIKEYFYPLPSYLTIENEVDSNGLQDVHILCFNKSSILSLEVTEEKDIKIEKKTYSDNYEYIKLKEKVVLEGKCVNDDCDTFEFEVLDVTSSLKRAKIKLDGKEYDISESSQLYLNKNKRFYELRIVSIAKNSIAYYFIQTYVTLDKLKLPNRINFDWLMLCYNREMIPITESSMDEKEITFSSISLIGGKVSKVVNMKNNGTIRYSIRNQHEDCNDPEKYEDMNKLEYWFYKKEGSNWELIDNATMPCFSRIDKSHLMVGGKFKLAVDKKLKKYTMLKWTDKYDKHYSKESVIFSDYKTGSKTLSLRSYNNAKDLTKRVAPRTFIIDLPSKISPLIGTSTSDTICNYAVKDADFPIINLESIDEGTYKLYGTMERTMKQYNVYNLSHSISTQNCDYYGKDAKYFIFLPEIDQNISLDINFKEGAEDEPYEEPSFIFKKTSFNNPVHSGTDIINTIEYPFNETNAEDTKQTVEVKEGEPYLFILKCGSEVDFKFQTYFSELYSKLSVKR